MWTTLKQPRLPLSEARLAADPLLFISGQGPIDAETDEFVTKSFEQQARLTLTNLARVASEHGTDLSRAVKVTVYLRHTDDFDDLNRIYREYFMPPFPARTTVQSNLAGFDIEVEAVLTVPTRDGRAAGT